MTLNDDYNIVAKKTLKYKEKNVFEIGHGIQSCTEVPGFYPRDDIYFVDCPGQSDQD